MEEIKFPGSDDLSVYDDWKTLYKLGYRIQKRTLEFPYRQNQGGQFRTYGLQMGGAYE